MLRNGMNRLTLRTLSNVINTTKHTPPKRLHGITGRYAGAVYTAASKVISAIKETISFFEFFFFTL
jgi:hypothetical protein